MVMAEPVRCPYMDFDIPHPCLLTDFNRGIKKIRTGIVIEQTLVDHTDPTTVNSGHPLPQTKPVLPHELHQPLHLKPSISQYYILGIISWN